MCVRERETERVCVGGWVCRCVRACVCALEAVGGGGVCARAFVLRLCLVLQVLCELYHSSKRKVRGAENNRT